MTRGVQLVQRGAESSSVVLAKEAVDAVLDPGFSAGVVHEGKLPGKEDASTPLLVTWQSCSSESRSSFRLFI